MINLKFDGKEIVLKPTKIIAVARNYKKHAKEMTASIPETPHFFLKPPSSIIANNGVVILPKMAKRIDHEVELAVVIKNQCRKLTAKEVSENILGYTIIVDVTARDIQAEAIKTGMPWTTAKGFDTFTPIGPKIVTAQSIDVNNCRIWLKINGLYKQNSNTKNMIFPVPELIAFISGVMTLEPMDIIATGTPEGVGPIKHGDFIEAGIEGIGILKLMVEQQI